MYLRLQDLTLLLGVVGVITATPVDTSSASVTVDQGVVNGFIDPSTPNVRQFLGIPFAKPPVGSLRFAPPEPAEPFGTINATELPASCQQRLSTSPPSIYTREILEFNLQGLNRTGTVSEDCLTLSVWAPSSIKKSLPVVIYIYGGGFSTGGQDVPYQLPPQWIQRTPEVIVVSFNYRLNIFGFPNAAGADRQNVGLLDQRLAVEWVRDNIAAFGGDPERMVLWGQSAGSASVSFFSYAWIEDPIVKGFIMDSPYSVTIQTSPANFSIFSTVAQQVGCSGLSESEELECVRQVDENEVEDAISATGASFGPTADELVVFANYTQRSLDGKIAKAPAIVGTNSGDGVPFDPYDQTWDEETVIENLLSFFFCPAWNLSRNRFAAGVPTYRFEYHGNFSNISPQPWLGAYHSAELPLVFGTHSLFRGQSTSFENATSRAMQDSWLSFAKNLNPGWPAYEEQNGGKVQHFGLDGQPASTGDTKWLEERC